MKFSVKTLLARAEAEAGAPTLTLRRGRRPDHAAVCRLLAEAYGPLQWAVPPGVVLPFFSDLFDLDARLRTGALLVAERRGRLVAAASYHRDGRAGGPPWPSGWAALRAFAVAPEVRCLGVGRMLLDACVRWATGDGADTLATHTPAFMGSTIALLEEQGFYRARAFDLALPTTVGPRPGPRLSLVGHVYPLV